MDDFAGLKRREGARVIYSEMPAVFLVRLGSIDIQPDGIRIAVSNLPTAGFTTIEKDSWKCSSSWQGFQHTENIWSAPNVSWFRYFDPRVIQSFTEFVSRVPVEVPKPDRFLTLAKELRRLAGTLPVPLDSR